MNYETLDVDRTGHVATLTLNRPDKLNAFNQQMTREFHEALDELDAEFPEIRVLILTGAGRGFCSGADVGMQAEGLAGSQGKRSDQRDAEDGFSNSILALGPHLPRLQQPVIAAVNGVAAGAGLSIALASDIRVASHEARFSSIFIKRSLVPDNGASYVLSALVGTGVAAEMAFTGRIYDAQWALEMGLVNQVVPADQLMKEVVSLAEEIASNPPLAVRSTKELLNSHKADLHHIAKVEDDANRPSIGTEDRREAILSFIEKRQPVYRGI